MKRFPGPEAPRATWNGNPVPLPTQTSTLCLNGNFSSTFGIRATVRSLRRAQWSVVSILALLALVTLRLPCTASALLKGEQGSACCAAMMDDDGKGACCEGASPAPKAELAPPALALLPTGAPRSAAYAAAFCQRATVSFAMGSDHGAVHRATRPTSDFVGL